MAEKLFPRATDGSLAAFGEAHAPPGYEARVPTPAIGTPPPQKGPPMNFVELGPIAPFSWVILGVSILVLFLAGMLLLKSSDSGFATLLSLTMTIGGAIGAGFSLESMTSVPLSDQRTEVGEQIEESYGLELSSEELKELDYPAAEPEGDFEVFGSIFRDQRTEDGFERTEIFLIWRDGEMALAGSPDGETFTELER